MDPPPSAIDSRLRRRLGRVFAWSLFAVILAFVAWRGHALWRQGETELREVEWRIGWLLPAAGAYALGWLPSVWFWNALMHRLGGRLRFRDTARAYYCGHLGKYVPGKASVLLIRAALMKNRGFRAAPAALTVAYETLVMMGSGLAVGLALSPLLLSDARRAALPEWLQWIAARPLASAAIVGSICLLLLPVIAHVFTRVAVRMMPRDMAASEDAVRIGPGLLLAGVAAFGVAWSLHGLSLGCTLQAVSVGPFEWRDWPVWTGAVAAATSVGFAVLVAPGGAGVREGILMEVLAARPEIDAKQALVVAVFLRIVWFATEIAVAAALYWMIRPERTDAAAQMTKPE